MKVQIYKLNASQLRARKSGQYDIVEDFVPFEWNRALITSGPGFRELTAVSEVTWQADGNQLVLSNPNIIRGGRYLRLGHYANGQRHALIYSDGFTGPHQPCLKNGHIYWTNDAPNGRIYRDGRLLIDHWPGVVEVANPWVTNESIYFEARDENVEAPHGWWIWRSDLDGKHRHRVARGANPCVFQNTLYYGSWDADRFDIVARSY